MNSFDGLENVVASGPALHGTLRTLFQRFVHNRQTNDDMTAVDDVKTLAALLDGVTAPLAFNALAASSL